MSDSRLVELERLSKDDPIARYRYRVECVRIGRPELAGYQAGDVVAVGLGGADWPWCSYTMDCADFSRAKIVRRATWLAIGDLHYYGFLLECCDPGHRHGDVRTGFAIDDRPLTLLEPARPA